MKIANFKRLIKEDVESQYRPLIDKIGYSINQFNDQIFTAFSKNITIDDNLNMEIKTIDVLVDSSGIPTTTITFKTSLSTKIRGISVEKALNLTNSNTYPSGAPFISFTDNSGTIIIQHITGLQINNKYSLTLLVKG